MAITMISPSRRWQDYLPEINRYVPAMTYAADLGPGKVHNIEFTSRARAGIATVDTDGILAAQSINTAVTVQRASLLSYSSPCLFGNTITLVASSTATSNVTVVGRDFWGQKVSKTIALTSGTPVTLAVAYCLIDYITFAATSSITVDVGWGKGCGLPYKAVKVLSDETDGAAQSVGTLTTPVLTDPATSSTLDPRGIWTMTGTPDGARCFSATFVFSDQVNASGNGGLLGIQHYGG